MYSFDAESLIITVSRVFYSLCAWILRQGFRHSLDVTRQFEITCPGILHPCLESDIWILEINKCNYFCSMENSLALAS
jgi:hypothetical protein